MELAPILPDVIKQSVLAGVLLFILYCFWTYFKQREEKNDEQKQKKDDALLNLMTDHSTKLLSVQEKTIESNNLLANAIGRFSESIDDNQATLIRELDEIKNGKKVTVRPLNGRAAQSIPDVVAKA